MRTVELTIVLSIVASCIDTSTATDTGDTGTATTTTTSGTVGTPTTSSGETETETETETTSTGADESTGTTGAADICTPVVETIPEAEFVSTVINTICAQKVECGCADDMCSVKFKADLEGVVKYAGDQGLVYDPSCAALAVHDYVTARGCMNGEQASYPFCGSCPVFRGDTADGAACMDAEDFATFLFSQPCAGSESLCIDGTCAVPPSGTLKLGEVCYSDEKTILLDCEPGTACDFFDSLRCEQELLEGDPCLVDDGVCGVDLVCGGKSVCAPYLPPGEPCAYDYDCASFYCEGSVCTEYVWICDLTSINDLFGGLH